MIIGISLLIAGIGIGLLLQKHKGVIKVTAKLTDLSIFLLLFFLGVSVGMNEQIISNFQKIGLQSLFITIAATLGSVFISFLVYKLFFKSRMK
jgi:uncharacterized membrane protein YbjE (DUF340 family)